jgi:hypothetical protein
VGREQTPPRLIVATKQAQTGGVLNARRSWKRKDLNYAACLWPEICIASFSRYSIVSERDLEDAARKLRPTAERDGRNAGIKAQRDSAHTRAGSDVDPVKSPTE